MKTLLNVGLCAIAFGAMASATQMSLTCDPSPAPFLGQTNSGTASCAGFTGLPGGATINWIRLDFVFDINVDAFAGGSSTTNYTIDAPGTGLDVSASTTQATRPDVGSVTITSGFGAFLAPFTVTNAYAGASSKVTGATFNEKFTIDYEPVPEPATYSMMAAGLLALAFARRKA